ncbi:glycosyltransferase family 2 protein [Thalassovita taeanensis]|uniref:Glycosyl transferase family 2 n=1 Tax=Thalassovita taeanensis TaxID=657014 RepID=A0A1H9KYA1_9RHOB|nr:glycosyltransferase family 2 protein [Thalassovita taeanensis]SER03979.1 Glycosyl transferase family 2 [Thalassovita taeanensis]
MTSDLNMPQTDTGAPATIAILLATYNGADNLQEQLDSYLTQTCRPDLLLVSDDGSSDQTWDILTRFANAHPDLPVTLLKGPKRGSAQNFLNLLRQTPDWIDVIALSDQDDVWLPHKLKRGLARLQKAPNPSAPLLYCGRSWECDQDLNNHRLSRGMSRPASFRHALVQNVAGGNTMILNRAALDLVCAASHEARKIVVHDWWLYQIIAGAGGQVLFDEVPQILYRQHGSNLIGANRGFAAKKKRLKMLISGRFRRWNTYNIKALTASSHRLAPENRQLLEQFAHERNRSAPHRLRLVWSAGLYRQGLQGNLSLYLAALLRRI